MESLMALESSFAKMDNLGLAILKRENQLE
jgi:hypothetical protein